MRVTHHPMPDRLVDWHPDGSRVLFVSSRESGRQRYSQFYLAPATGGLPAKLAVPYGEFGSFSPDGSKIAYLPQTQAFRTWKRYRGGWSPDIWEFDLTTLAAKNVTTNDAVDEFPMWHGDTVYFLSDRGAGQKQNIWARNRSTGAVRQITDFRDYDVTFPSLGPGDIVFGAGSRLYLLDLATDKVSEVQVQVVTDRSTLKARSVKVGDDIASVSVSPTGKRAAFEARGEIFSVPAENGPVMSVSRSSGVAERYPRWSPDGKTLAYWSDRSGEYELTLRPADGTGSRAHPHLARRGVPVPAAVVARQHTHGVRGSGHEDSRRSTSPTGRVVDVDQSPIWMSHGQLEAPDASMVARFALAHVGARHRRLRQPGRVPLRRHAGARGTRPRRATSTTASRCSIPTASISTSSRTALSTRSTATSTTAGRTPIPTRIVAVTLRADGRRRLRPRTTPRAHRTRRTRARRTRSKKDDEKKDDEKKDDEKKDDAKKDDAPAKPKPVEIDLDGFESRVIVLPPKAGNYDGLQAVSGKISIGASREPARATRRARWCTSTSRSAKRRPCSPRSTASR